MNAIPRHVLASPRDDIARAIEKHEVILARYLSADVWFSSETAIFSGIAFDNAVRRAWFDPGDRAIVSDLELCACLCAAACASVSMPGDGAIVAPAPGDRSVSVTRANGLPERFDPPNHWRWGILAARIARNHAALDLLAAMRVGRLLELSPAVPSWFATEASALCATFRDDPAAGDLLVEAMERTDPNTVESASRNYVLDVVAPEIEAAFRVLEGEPAKFDTVLHQAIEGHHHYYGSDGKGHFHGQLALAPLAMACFGYDRGLRTTVESDYLPRWICELPAR